MYRTMKSCFCSIFQAVPGKAMRYMGCKAIAAILFPANVVLVERCISSMEGAFYREFWLTFPAFLLCAFVLVVTEHCGRVADMEFTQEFTDAYMPKVIHRLTGIRYGYFEDEKAADVLSRLNGDPAAALTGLFKKMVDCIALLIRLYGAALIYFRLSAAVGLSLFLLLGLQVYIGILSQREVVKLFETETQEERKLQYLGSLLCGKDSVFDLKVNQSVAYVEGLQKRKARRILRDRVRISLKAETYYMLNLLLMLAWTGALLYFLVAKLAAGEQPFGLFVALMGSYPALAGDQNALSYHLSSMKGDLLVYRAVSELWDYEEEQGDCELAAGEPCTIEFRHVCFRYPGMERWALKDISFRVRSDETLALVGENGSGKSTVIKLLCGLYQPEEGEILADGQPIGQLSPESRRKLTSVVFQDFENYSLTAGENIGLGNVARMDDRESILEAARRAGAAEILEGLPKGPDTPLNHLEEDGVSLSGGQWQRLAIARAYMAESAFFLLDEPTASMDPIAESRMYQSFVDILKGKGIILVSHRLASAKMADRILVLDGGTLAQDGTHEGLMQAEGIYREMFERQAGWYQAPAS